MVGKTVFDYSFKKSLQAVTQGTTPKVYLDGETVHVEPKQYTHHKRSLQGYNKELVSERTKKISDTNTNYLSGIMGA